MSSICIEVSWIRSIPFFLLRRGEKLPVALLLHSSQFYFSSAMEQIMKSNSRINLAYIILRNKQRISMLRSIFPFAFPPTTAENIANVLGEFELYSNLPLPQNYYKLLFAGEDITQSLAVVISNISKARTSFEVIKLFTIIIKALRVKEYNRETLELLESIQAPPLSEFEQKDVWINEVSIAIKSYLARLPSLGEVFQRALKFKTSGEGKDYSLYLSDLYRMLNLFGLLFPGLTNCLNAIGRYFLKTSPYFLEFYKTLKEELLLGYQYIQHIVSSFKAGHLKSDPCSLDCFLKTIPEIELYCDKIEEFMQNKYFKGKGAAKKIYFRYEEIDEMVYHLKSMQQPEVKTDDFVQSTDEEDFGEYQQ